MASAYQKQQLDHLIAQYMNSLENRDRDDCFRVIKQMEDLIDAAEKQHALNPQPVLPQAQPVTAVENAPLLPQAMNAQHPPPPHAAEQQER